jgi:DNA-binding transcriptional LysR family regulator
VLSASFLVHAGADIMEMQQVRYFVALCETLNFTRAAEICNVSQPSLTRAIQQLEGELGGPLFNRERNNTHLTELGHSVRPHLEEIMAHTSSARRRAQQLAQLRSARLKLGLCRGFALQPLDYLLERYLAAYPDTEILLQEEGAAKLCELLRAGEFEVAVIPPDVHQTEDLHYYLLATQSPQLVVPRDHPLAERRAAGLTELGHYPLVCFDSCAFLAAAQHMADAEGPAIRPRIVTGSMDWLFELVRGGLGVGLVSDGHRLPDDLVGWPLDAVQAVREINLATKRGRLYSPPVKAFVDLALRPARRQSAA